MSVFIIIILVILWYSAGLFASAITLAGLEKKYALKNEDTIFAFLMALTGPINFLTSFAGTGNWAWPPRLFPKMEKKNEV